MARLWGIYKFLAGIRQYFIGKHSAAFVESLAHRSMLSEQKMYSKHSLRKLFLSKLQIKKQESLYLKFKKFLKGIECVNLLKKVQI